MRNLEGRTDGSQYIIKEATFHVLLKCQAHKIVDMFLWLEVLPTQDLVVSSIFYESVVTLNKSRLLQYFGDLVRGLDAPT